MTDNYQYKIRIVRMVFQPEYCETFENIFKEAHAKISTFPGCKSVQLLKDEHNPNVYYTLSYWESNEALENYRVSDLFKHTWSKTKILFAEKPLAYTLSNVVKPL